jgi:cytochrome b561
MATLSESYSLISKLLHWILAALLIGLIGLGWYMTSIENQSRDWYFNLHKSFGLVAAFLILLRIIWRLKHKPAPLPNSVPIWQAKISRLIHFLLYICIIFMPMTGFIGACYSKSGIKFFGIQLPTLVNKNREIANVFFNIHGVIAWILVCLIALHILAAIKHLLINKDGVFQRMWF